MEFIPVLLGGLLLFVGIKYFVRMPGYALAKKFRVQGDMKGMDLNMLVSKVGKYSSYRNLADGRKVCVWQAPGYIISLVIDANNKVLSIGSETSV